MLRVGPFFRLQSVGTLSGSTLGLSIPLLMSYLLFQPILSQKYWSLPAWSISWTTSGEERAHSHIKIDEFSPSHIKLLNFFMCFLGSCLREFTFILVILNISNFASMDFIYSVYHCPFETTRRSTFIIMAFLYFVYPLFF
jgi:hypothetical protein